jgi:hypothetical protein
MVVVPSIIMVNRAGKTTEAEGTAIARNVSFLFLLDMVSRLRGLEYPASPL